MYIQPEPPAPDYIWTPGYWAYNSFFEDYYWVPGTWVTAPSPGLLWTPGYWSWREGNFVFSNGYWGDHVGFYGGINYGHGYEGRGFSGGGWNNNVFVNKRVNVTNINITNNVTNISSFNGGPGGVNAKPTSEERSAMKEHHIPPTAVQQIQVQTAVKNPGLRASANHGKPAIAATVKPGVFQGNGVVAARQAGAFYNKTKAITPRVPAFNTNNANNPRASSNNTGNSGMPAFNKSSAVIAHSSGNPGTVGHVPSNQAMVKAPVKKPVAKKPVAKKPKPKPPQQFNADGTPIKNPQ